ncbi:MAG TPA: nucleotidyltransferase family protein [Labilithrix sp.]|nr:nucleotidyltransferase family protein [Labilithrix sp.]
MLFDRAERHGLAGVLLDTWRAKGMSLPGDLARHLDVREMARELDHRAHLALLTTIDEHFSREGLVGVILKGPMFAERFYARPSARATSDIDLLVEPGTLEHASKVLTALGYVGAEGPEEDRVRREHHHLHFTRADALPLELHFHGYTGFGQVLPSPPLLGRREPVAGLRALGVLAPEDELVFLSVHAAAHRYVRLGWLYDLRLLIATMTERQLAIAAERARSWGFARVLAFTACRLVDLLAVPESILAPLGAHRGWLVARAVVHEPANAVLSSATRMVYTVALCDKKSAAARYVLRASTGHLRRLLHLPP